MSESEPLPAGWYENKDPESGDTYYYTNSGETSWTRPTAPAPGAAEQGTVDEGGSDGTFVRPAEETKQAATPTSDPQPTVQSQPVAAQPAAAKAKSTPEKKESAPQTPTNFVAAGSHPRLTGHLAELDKYIMSKFMATLLVPATGIWGFLIWFVPQALWCAIEFISSIVYMANMGHNTKPIKGIVTFYFLPVWLFLDSIAFAADIAFTLLFILLGPGKDMVKNPPTIFFTGLYSIYSSPKPVEGLFFTIRWLSLIGLRIFNVAWSFVGSIVIVLTAYPYMDNSIVWWFKKDGVWITEYRSPDGVFDISIYTLTASWVFIFMQVTYVLIFLVVRQCMNRAADGEKDIKARPVELADNSSEPMASSDHAGATENYGSASV